MFQNAEKKGLSTLMLMIRPDVAPMRQVRGTFANDRLPVAGTIGRETGQVRLRVTQNTKQRKLKTHVEQFTAQH